MGLLSTLVGMNLLFNLVSGCLSPCLIFSLDIERDRQVNKTMLGHVISSFPVSLVFECWFPCSQDCRCQSFDLTNNLTCVLHSERAETSELSHSHESGHFDMVMTGVSEETMIGPCTCHNECCQSNPCYHGGECVEICTGIERLLCKCPNGTSGRFCQNLFRSCQDYLKFGSQKNDFYVIYDITDQPFTIFCDFESDETTTWSLITSYSRSNQELFIDYPFYVNHPVHENISDWLSYRLSKTRMDSLRNVSTLSRVTCNFNAFGLGDYACAQLETVDLFSNTNNMECSMFNAICISGDCCTNCTAVFHQSDGSSPYMDIQTSCQGNASHEISPGRYFGGTLGDAINSTFSCLATENATTNWWLGISNYECNN